MNTKVRGICKIKDCGKRHFAKGFCACHYAQMQKAIIDLEGNSIRPLKRIGKLPAGAVCKYPDCERAVRTRGWCSLHYSQFRLGIIDGENNTLREKKWRPGRGWRSYCRGYRKVMAKGHPHADRDGYILEHRLVMEKQLGRYLDPKEVVHHINGKRDDNRVENLQLRSSRKEHGHGHERVADVEGAISLLEKLVNQGMTNGESLKARLNNLAERL